MYVFVNKNNCLNYDFDYNVNTIVMSALDNKIYIVQS